MQPVPEAENEDDDSDDSDNAPYHKDSFLPYREFYLYLSIVCTKCQGMKNRAASLLPDDVLFKESSVWYPQQQPHFHQALVAWLPWLPLPCPQPDRLRYWPMLRQWP